MPSMRPRGQTPRMPRSWTASRPRRASPSMRPRGQTPRMPVERRPVEAGACTLPSMRPRGQTPRMLSPSWRSPRSPTPSMRPRGQTPRMPRRDAELDRAGKSTFNEAAGADPADARVAPAGARLRQPSMRPRGQTPRMRAGWHVQGARLHSPSMRPRGQTPRMPPAHHRQHAGVRPSMRPRGQTPRMRVWETTGLDKYSAFNEAAGADPADARRLCSTSRARPSSMRPRGQTPRMPTSVAD